MKSLKIDWGFEVSQLVRLIVSETSHPQMRLTERKIDVASDQVLDLYKDPKHRLCLQSEVPPIELVHMLQKRIQGTRSIGPGLWTTPEYINKLSPLLIENGRVQNCVEGHFVVWLDGCNEFRSWSHSKLFALDSQQVRLVGDLIRRRDEYYHQRHEECISSVMLEMAAQRKAFLVNPVSRDGLVFWVKLKPAEYEFVEAVDELKRCVNTALKAALQEGRVVVAPKSYKGEKPIDPTDLQSCWKDGAVLSSDVLLLPTSEFSEPWLLSKLKSQKLKKQVAVRQTKEFLEAIYTWGVARGLQASRKDLRDFVIKECKISGEAFDEAWRTANITEWSKSGRIKAKYKIDYNKISDLNNRGEVPWPDSVYFP